jgi:hypothetical protein
MEGGVDPPSPAENRPPKRRRGAGTDSDTESDSQGYLDHYLNDSDTEEQQHWPRPDTAIDIPTWIEHEVVPAETINALDCVNRSMDRLDTHTIEDECGGCIGTWEVCRNPRCYSCQIILEAMPDRDMG